MENLGRRLFRFLMPPPVHDPAASTRAAERNWLELRRRRAARILDIEMSVAVRDTDELTIKVGGHDNHQR